MLSYAIGKYAFLRKFEPSGSDYIYRASIFSVGYAFSADEYALLKDRYVGAYWKNFAQTLLIMFAVWIPLAVLITWVGIELDSAEPIYWMATIPLMAFIVWRQHRLAQWPLRIFPGRVPSVPATGYWEWHRNNALKRSPASLAMQGAIIAGFAWLSMPNDLAVNAYSVGWMLFFLLVAGLWCRAVRIKLRS